MGAFRGALTLGRVARKSWRWWAGAALLVAVTAGTVSVAQLAEAHVRTADSFATEDVSLEGNERLTREDVLGIAALQVGDNVFEVAPEVATSRLLAHPWIAEASVRRELPSRFVISIREHRAVALLSLDGLYLVSEDGSVFKRVAPGEVADLPVVTGVDRGRFTRDLNYRTGVLTEAVALLHDYRGAGLWRREPISEVHVEVDEGISLYVGEDGMRVRLGRSPYREKLVRLRRILIQLKSQEARAEYVHLDNIRRPDRVTVRLR